jgi:hypothetical protein
MAAARLGPPRTRPSTLSSWRQEVTHDQAVKEKTSWEAAALAHVTPPLRM